MKGKDTKTSKWKQKLSSQPPEATGLAHTRTGDSSRASKASQALLQQLVLTLQIHNSDYSKEDVILNSELFGDALKENDFIEMCLVPQLQQAASLASLSSQAQSNAAQPNEKLSATNSGHHRNPFGSPPMMLTPSNTLGKTEKRLIVRLGKDSMRQQRFQISLLKQIADMHNLKANMTCKIRLLTGELVVETPQPPKGQTERQLESSQSLTEESVTIAPYIADRVEIVFRDQLVSRRDMWKIQQFLDGKAVYKGKSLEFMGIRFTIRGLFNRENQEQLTGVVKLTHSKFFYFSKSSQVYILIEVSEEMYEFDQESGFTFNEKCIQFLKAYFERCAKSSSSHEVTIVMYSRLYYPQVKCKEELRVALSEHYQTPAPLTDEQISHLGAFQISKHTKVFQDMYLKVGVFEILGGGRGNWEKSLQNLKRYFNYLPSMLNWSIKCPQHVEDLKRFYPRHMNQHPGSFISSLDEMLLNNIVNEAEVGPHEMMPCWMGSAEKQSILEAINLALFNLNNEEEDQNLKSTGQQLLIVTAGQGTYRINANVIEPTKSRVLLGGIPIQLISLNHRPPFKTPLLVNCCTYANPFKNNKKHATKIEVPNTDLKQQLKAQLGDQNQEMQSSKAAKQACDAKFNSNPPYYYPYWLDIIYLPYTKLFEVHGSQVQNPQSAVYKVQKIPPYNATNSPYDYHPMMSQAFLDEIQHVEDLALRAKLLEKYGMEELPQTHLEQVVTDLTAQEEGLDNDEGKIIVMQTSDYCLGRHGSLSSSEKSDLLRSLEKEDALNFRKQPLKEDHKHSSKSPLRRAHQNSGSNYARRKQEPVDPSTRRRSYHNQQTNFIMEELSDDANGDDIIVVERESMVSLEQPLRGGPGYNEEQNRDRIYTNQSNFVQSLQEKTSMDDLLSHNPADPYDSKAFGGQLVPAKGLKEPGVTVVGQNPIYTHRLSYMGSPSPTLAELGGSNAQKIAHYDPFSPKSKLSETHTLPSIGGTTKHGQYQSSNSFGGSQNIKFSISPLSLSPMQPAIAPAPKGSPEAQKFKPSSLKNRWSHQAPPSAPYSVLSDEEINVLLHFGTPQQVESVMEPFWKSLCECKLMPLTTDFVPSDKVLKNTQKYHNELSQVYQKRMALIKGVDDYLAEYICLRLTQNFQLINPDPNPTCFIDTLSIIQRRNQIKMSMGHKFDIFTAVGKEDYKIMTFTKMSTEGGREDAHAVKRADFKYMLFNFHTNRFQVKTSSESRLFNFKSLLNLSEVLYDLQMAHQSCIKMPQNHFVVFFYNPPKPMFDKKSTEKQASLNPVEGISSMDSKRSQPNSQASSLYQSASLRSATMEIGHIPSTSHKTNEYQQILLPSQSVDLNQKHLSKNLALNLYEQYGILELSPAEQQELQQFSQFKVELFEMLTKSNKSKYNTQTNLGSIQSVQISMQPGSGPIFQQSRPEDELYKPYEPQSETATAYIEDETPNGTVVNGAYFFSHDSTYRPQHCFHITVSWIFANGPQISEKINSLKRKVKSCGLQIIPISGVVNKDELNPFENFTRLKTVQPLDGVRSQGGSSYGRRSSSFKARAGGVYPYNTHKLSLDSTGYYVDEEVSIPRNEYAEHLREKRCTTFIRRFEHFLRNYYGFVIESENKIYRNYIHFSGIAVIRIYHNSEVAWIENDVVNNQMADYSESHRVQEKVDVLIFTIDLILDMVFDRVLLPEDPSTVVWKGEAESI